MFIVVLYALSATLSIKLNVKQKRWQPGPPAFNTMQIYEIISPATFRPSYMQHLHCCVFKTIHNSVFHVTKPITKKPVLQKAFLVMGFFPAKMSQN